MSTNEEQESVTPAAGPEAQPEVAPNGGALDDSATEAVSGGHYSGELFHDIGTVIKDGVDWVKSW